jgi:hypothetical protein
MKRIVSLLVFMLLLNGCNDGNLTVGTIDFSKATTQSCSTTNVIYKLNTQEALILQIPSTSFTNKPTVPGTPTIINIDNSTYRVIYRAYNGAIASDNICSAIPPSTPTVTDQWTATSGTIQIITTPITATGTITGSTVITGYNHNISFKNITFSRANGNQVYETFAFGDYVTTAKVLPFGFDKTVEQCSTSKQIYNYTSSEALTLDIDPTLIQNSETPLNSPRTGLLSATTNKLIYRLYNGLLTPSYFCNTTIPQLPTFDDEWVGVNGVTGISGIVEITTIKNGTTAYKHTIVLKNVTLTNGTSSFKLGDSYIYGDLLTN